VERLLAVLLFEPLIRAFKEPKNNAKPNKNALIRHIENGSLVYADGAFVGERNSTLSRTLKSYGAKFNSTRKAWVVPLDKLPFDVRDALDKARTRAAALERFSDGFLQETLNRAKSVMPEVSFQGLSRETLLKMADRVRATVPKELSVQPEIDHTAQRQLNKDYTDNVRLSIVGFIDDEVARFRKEILPEIRQGVGRKSVQRYVMSRLKIGRDRAKFIARQETALFTSKLKEVQYKSAGIDKFRWKAIGGSRGDGRTRDSHMDAHGKIFYFDRDRNDDGISKPVNGDGRTVNPGQDFGCRCQAIPIVDEL
jgi:SPP1 gp7 family putative phage head morphogenesis protein